MTTKAQIRAKAKTFLADFIKAGAAPVETDMLLPAETLLDLYGEDIRTRAYITYDPDRGEMMLRPDFTVPVVQMHMRDGAAPATYAYLGDVFRKQPIGMNRPNEYLQVGFELFDKTNPVQADSTVFSLFCRVLAPLGLRPVIGDIGLVRAAIASLSVSDLRKGRLYRHIWRPQRFGALLDKMQNPVTRRDLTNVQTGPNIGLRGQDDIKMRLADLAAESRETPLNSTQATAMAHLLNLTTSLDGAAQHLTTFIDALPHLAPAVETFTARVDAMKSAGVDISQVQFDGGFGRSSMEYYDGFVFGFLAKGNPNLPPIASGGRYDALTRVLGAGRALPAVGGVIRPELALALEQTGGMA
jgi:ATP phosphoribosyltransferase regulatory subunit